jgi:hypothetical protein
MRTGQATLYVTFRIVKNDADIAIVMVDNGIANISTVLNDTSTSSSERVLANNLGYNANAKEAE